MLSKNWDGFSVQGFLFVWGFFAVSGHILEYIYKLR